LIISINSGFDLPMTVQASRQLIKCGLLITSKLNQRRASAGFSFQGSKSSVAIFFKSAAAGLRVFSLVVV
jgi:hypothetical protein